MLRACGLAKSYPLPGGRQLSVLQSIDLSVTAGELVLITGASGSGKSTLLNCLGLLEEVDTGDVWYGDERVSALGRAGRARARGRFVGFVFQSFLLLPSLTALDNVLLAARYTSRVDRATRRRALDLLASVGMVDRADHYPAQLSGGEQQRVAYCRAMLNAPALVLADEPTGNLDDENAQVILAALAARAAAGGAVVVVSHRHDLVATATRTLTLANGRLAATASE